MATSIMVSKIIAVLFVEKREQKILSEEKKEEVQQALLEWNLPYIQSEHAMAFRIYGKHI